MTTSFALKRRPTLVNLAHHSYFNLGGTADCLDHTLSVNADRFTPIAGDLIPTGDILPVEGTVWDFREPRPIRLERDGSRVLYDHNLVLADGRRPEPQLAATASNPETGLAMEVWTTEPGLQFYDGAKIDLPVSGLDGRVYRACAGFCLEPQVFPDSPNEPDFPSAVLRPGETYRQVTEFRFARS